MFRFQNPQEARSIQSSKRDQHQTKEDSNIIDWDYAQLELHEKQGIDLKQEMENKFIEIAEKCRKEKEEALQCFAEHEKTYKEIIKNLIEQLGQSQSMQNSVVDSFNNSFNKPAIAAHFDMLQKGKIQTYIFEDLKNDREIQLCKKILVKWKTHQFTSLRDDLWGNTIFLKEANVLSNEMKKKVQYQFCLIQNTQNSNCLSGSFSKLSQEQLKQFGSIYSNDEVVTNWPKTLVAVEVKDQRNGVVHYWSLKKLRDRLELMREKYAEYMKDKYNEFMKDKKNEYMKDKFNEFMKDNRYIEQNEKSPNSPESEKGSSIIEDINDPFTDRPTWYRLIGRSYLYLSNLLYNVRMVQTIPIVNEKCDIKGYLQVLIEPNTDDENQEHDKFQNNNNIKQSARCLFQDDDPAMQELEDELNFYSSSYQYNITDLTKWIVKKLPNRKKLFSLLDEELRDEEVFVDLDLNDDEPTYSDRIALNVGDEFTFRIVILQIINLDKKYADIICNFNFLHRLDEAFSERITTASMSTAGTIGFFAIQNLSVKVTASFIKYLQKFPIFFEIFGNNQQHPLHDQARDFIVDDQNKLIGGPPKNLFPSQIPFSTPIKPQKLDNFTTEILDNLMNLNDNISQSQPFCQLPINISFEICELTTAGDYMPVPVIKKVNKTLLDADCEQNVFLLKQGVQRRIRITLNHHQLPESFSKKCGDFKVNWIKIVEVVLGRVRSIPYCSEDFCDEEDSSVVSLPLFYGEFMNDETRQQSRQYSSELEDNEFGDNFYENGEMIKYRFEAAWDTSLHNSELLDKVGEGNERTVFFTLSAYLEVGHNYFER